MNDVQEHLFTIPQIQECLEELGLMFCGFEAFDIRNQFQEFFGQGANIQDLALWDQFEECNPDSFEGMYQLWCQKL